MREELEGRLQFYSVVYPERLRNNSFLMLFSLFEETMVDTCRLVSGAAFTGVGSGIKRFKKPLYDAGLDLFDTGDWAFLMDCQKIRNALLHANGRPHLLKAESRPDLEGVLARRPHCFVLSAGAIVRKDAAGNVLNERLAVTAQGVNRLYDAVANICEALLEKTGVKQP